MTETILVAGTASHVGKSTVVAGLCRLLAERGLDVAPFKAQNMSNNAHVGVTPTGEWGEIAVSQYVQARAAGVPAKTDHNPVLLKPRGNGESQVVVDGTAIGHYESERYYDEQWMRARTAAEEAHERLAAANDVVVAEGAGSIAEINLHHRDLANVETARFADAKIFLVGDIERGGVFASLYGTLELMPADLRERVVGTVITKFRGDESILEDGLRELEDRTGVPVLAVLPHDDPGLPAEDSLDLPTPSPTGSLTDDATIGNDDATIRNDDATIRNDDATIGTEGDEIATEVVPSDRRVTVGVVRLPHISNATDFHPLARMPGVEVTYIHHTHAGTTELDQLDALVLPGTKNTVDDLLALRHAGFDDALAEYDGPVLGICGGYQMLGERITNADIEGTGAVTEDGGGTESTVEGFGRLPVETRFSSEKTVEPVSVAVTGGGFLPELDLTVDGYEIHMGETVTTDDHRGAPDGSSAWGALGPESIARDATIGTYVHGLFENEPVRNAFVESLHVDRASATPQTVPDTGDGNGDPYGAAAELVAPLGGALDRVLAVAPDCQFAGASQDS